MLCSATAEGTVAEAFARTLRKGDGSLLMRASEISVAFEQSISPVYIAWMDGALAQIETKQLRQSPRPVGVRVPSVSCAKVADAFGGT